MKIIFSTLMLLALLALPGRPLHAADPPPASTPGQVLILKNEHTMEGTIERIGDRYRVRRAIGETWIPADRVLGVVPSLVDAYGFLRKRANLDDADERLRLANWCRLNGLREQALTEVQAAVDVRPDHAPTRRLLEHLKQAALMTSETKRAASAEHLSADQSLPPVEVTSESLGLFATRVQPILMNTCARCHATGKGGNLHLTQVYEDSIGNRRTLERNLAAVLRHINLNQPEASRLLDKAVTDHAHVGQAPLRDRKAPPYRTLEQWVKLTVESNPHLRDSRPDSAPPSAPIAAAPTPPRLPPTPERRPAPAGTNTDWGVEGRPAAAPAPPAPSAPVSGPATVSNTVAAAPPPPPPAAPADPYDPEAFNRQAHPESSKAPQPKK